MTDLARTSLCIALLALLSAAPASADDRLAGTVVSISGETYVVELGDEPGVSPGTVLQAWRRLPSARGTATYRDVATWWDVGRLTVRSVSDGVAVATWSGPPDQPLPSGLDESGVPADRVHVGDRVRATAAVGQRPGDVRVAFALADLFGPADLELAGGGQALFGRWLKGLRSIEGPIEVEVHPRLAELGETMPDLSREMSLDGDAPFGPAPGDPVVPVEALYEGAPSPALVPDAREVLVVSRGAGEPDVWHYLDPVSLARRRGEQVAAALSAHLELPPGSVLVRVVPHPTIQEGLVRDAPGYDVSGEQLRILATGIHWSEPVDEPVRRRVKEQPKEDEQGSEDKDRRRRILERPPEDIS